MGYWIFKLLPCYFLNVCVGTGSYVRELEEQGIETKYRDTCLLELEYQGVRAYTLNE